MLFRSGDVIARIADLRTFRVDATASDIHAGTVAAGLPVNVVVNDSTLGGTISEVRPSVDNGVVRFTVALQEPSHRALRPNMRVVVQVVTGRKARTLTVRQGPFVSGGERGEAFVIRGDRAVKAAVAFGLRGGDDVEIVTGLLDGEEVIVSDMRDYLHIDELEVR